VLLPQGGGAELPRGDFGSRPAIFSDHFVKEGACSVAVEEPHSVLIADDDDDIRRLVSAVLANAGISANTVEGGHAALDAARSHSRRLILLDVRMPDLSGLDVCRALKADPATAESQVLLMSAEHSAADVAAGYAAGADDYLAKPFSPRELVRRVGRLMVGPGQTANLG
jgi:DNA-binding response OmpR family regulator